MPLLADKKTWSSPWACVPDQDRFGHVLSRLEERCGVVCEKADLERAEARIRRSEAQRVAGQPYPVIFPQFVSEDAERDKLIWSATLKGNRCLLVVDKPTLKIVSAAAFNPCAGKEIIPSSLRQEAV